MNRWLIVMAKEPRAGSVKTRLARETGFATATQFYRSALANLMRRVGQDPRWRTVLAVSPDTALSANCWGGHKLLAAQGSGDLGARLQRVFDGLPTGPAVIIGTDIPEIAPRHIAKAFEALGQSDAVIGPGEDGGYWLVGAKRAPRILPFFENVRWSSPHTLDDTLANLKHADVALLERLADVDDAATLKALGRAASRTVLPVG